jgi:hypothetical protein
MHLASFDDAESPRRVHAAIEANDNTPHLARLKSVVAVVIEAGVGVVGVGEVTP